MWKSKHLDKICTLYIKFPWWPCKFVSIFFSRFAYEKIYILIYLRDKWGPWFTSLNWCHININKNTNTLTGRNTHILLKTTSPSMYDHIIPKNFIHPASNCSLTYKQLLINKRISARICKNPQQWHPAVLSNSHASFQFSIYLMITSSYSWPSERNI